MSYKKIKQEILEEEDNGNNSWLDQMEAELNFDSVGIKEEFKSNCDNAALDFGIDRERVDWRVKQELEENTNDSVKSIASDSRKSDRKSGFKRKVPYDVPQQPPVDEPSIETSPSCSENKKKKKEYETDPVILKRRQKQIDFGKNTIGYDNYIQKVAKKERGKEDPVTPKKHLKYSRRAWDGLIRQWRLRLHNYDQ